MAAPQAGTDAARRKRQLGIIAGLALALVAVAVAVSLSGGEESGDVENMADVAALYNGIAQDGIALGDPGAPATMAEFADPQCPFCADYATAVLPELIDRYVRPGELRLELNLLTFIGPDSERAARVALAAAQQDRMWEFMDLLYREQGAENSGYATDEFLRGLAEQVPGLDVDRVFADRDGAAVDRLLAAAQAEANRLRVNSTPSFFVSRDGGSPEPLTVSALEPDAFLPRLDELTAGG